MPEGDTVMWTAARLNAALADTMLTRTDLRTPRTATIDLAGHESLIVATYGKHLLHRVDGGVTIHSHLVMEGRWSVMPAPSTVTGAAWRQASNDVRRAVGSHTTRALLYTANAVAVGSNLGVLELIPTVGEKDVIGHLGPDILATSWLEPTSSTDAPGRDTAVRRLREQPERPLGEALLDQRNLAGLGTFWVSEMLWKHRVLPWRRVADIDDDTLLTVLDDARTRMLTSGQTGIQTSTGCTGAGETKAVHARSGMACPRCNDTVRVAMAGPPGRERTLFTCPACQGGYAPNDDRRPQGVLAERPRRSTAYRARR